MTVDEQALASAEASVGAKFPADYRRIMKSSDGLEEMLPSAYVVLWSLQEVVEIHSGDAYGLRESLPDLLLIGGDGGGELLAFDLRFEPAPVVLINAVSTSWDEVSPQADSVASLLAFLRAGGSYSFI